MESPKGDSGAVRAAGTGGRRNPGAAAGTSAESLFPGGPGGPVTETVRISSLRPADSPRRPAEDPDHVRALAQLEADALPPLVVHRATRRVIDGTHRLAAARLRGAETVQVRYVECAEEEAFLLGVRLNVAHGLPLSLTERRAAAERMLATHGQRSDRAIAAVTGLSAATVRDLRTKAPDRAPAPDRIGRDGKRRPLSSAEGRRSAGELVRADARIPLRHLAERSGISLGTAADVRARVLRGEDPVPPQQRHRGASAAHASGEITSVTSPVRPRSRTAAPGADGDPARDQRPGAEPRLSPPDMARVMRGLVADPSLRLTDQGRRMLRWLSGHLVDPQEWQTFVGEVPSHCAETVAGLAHACSESWRDFAHQLEQRRDEPA